MKGLFTKSFLLLIALLCGSELVVRVFFARNMSGRFEYGYHPTSGFVERADGTVQLVRAGGRRFHPQSFSRQRPEGTFRIMVIGDSVPRGPSLQASYASLLGDKLRARGINAESFNLAVPGVGARRNQLVLRQALNYQPDLLILHVNNSNEFEDTREWRRAQEFKTWHPKNWPMKSLVFRRLYEMKTEKLFWKWLPSEVRDQAALHDADAEVSASVNEAKVREWDEQVRRVTTESVALTRQSGVPILLLTQVRRENRPDGSVVLDDHGLDTLVRPLVGAGVQFLSMKELLEPQEFKTLFSDGSHLTRAGHIAIAAAIEQHLRESKLVP